MSAHSISLIVLFLGVALAMPAPGRRRAGQRLKKLPVAVRGGERSGAAVRRSGNRVDPIRLGTWLGAAAVAILVGGWFGMLAAFGAAIAIDRWLRRLPTGESRKRRRAEAAELPLAADLLAVTLRSGATVDHATAAVAEAVAGPLGDRLARVARMLRLGAAPADAWAELAPVPGADKLVLAAVRSAEHGSALAAALNRLADDLRTDRAVATEAAARRAGVLIVLPLGLCFLPAFILAGLVPVIIAVLGDVL